MESDSSLAILILVAALLAFAGVSVAQAAFLRLGQRGGLPWPEGEVAARPIRRLIPRYDRLAVLLSLLRIASVLTAGLSLVAWVLAGAEATWGLATLFAVVLLLVIVLVQSIARALGWRYHRGVLLVASPVLVGAYWMFSPLLWVAEHLGGSVQQWGQGDAITSSNGQSPAQVEAMPSFPADDLREADSEEHRMISAILGLEEVAVREIMVPRVDVMAVEEGTPLVEVATLMAVEGHSRLLVYDETIDNVVGIVHARDVLQRITSEEGAVGLTSIARQALFIPDSKPLDELLREFQERRVTIAVVVDEYGGTEGLVTMEDVLEEIVGEIEDEAAREEPDIVQVSDKEAIVDGRVTLDEVNELFQTHLEGEGFDTVGGLLSARLGKIPATGDDISLEGLTLRVLSTSGRRVRKVRVVKQP